MADLTNTDLPSRIRPMKVKAEYGIIKKCIVEEFSEEYETPYPHIINKLRKKIELYKTDRNRRMNKIEDLTCEVHKWEEDYEKLEEDIARQTTIAEGRYKLMDELEKKIASVERERDEWICNLTACANDRLVVQRKKVEKLEEDNKKMKKEIAKVRDISKEAYDDYIQGKCGLEIISCCFTCGDCFDDFSTCALTLEEGKNGYDLLCYDCKREEEEETDEEDDGLQRCKGHMN